MEPIEEELIMGFEELVGLTVIDDKGYQAYRDAMTPILTSLAAVFATISLFLKP